MMYEIDNRGVNETDLVTQHGEITVDPWELVYNAIENSAQHLRVQQVAKVCVRFAHFLVDTYWS